MLFTLFEFLEYYVMVRAQLEIRHDHRTSEDHSVVNAQRDDVQANEKI